MTVDHENTGGLWYYYKMSGIQSWQMLFKTYHFSGYELPGLVNVPIQHHPTVGD